VKTFGAFAFLILIWAMGILLIFIAAGACGEGNCSSIKGHNNLIRVFVVIIAIPVWVVVSKLWMKIIPSEQEQGLRITGIVTLLLPSLAIAAGFLAMLARLFSR
jgi:hypothetical protein